MPVDSQFFMDATPESLSASLTMKKKLPYQLGHSLLQMKTLILSPFCLFSFEGSLSQYGPGDGQKYQSKKIIYSGLMAT